MCPLTCNGDKVGVLQLINKKRGLIGKADLEVAKDVSDLVGNYVTVMLRSFKLMNTVEEFTVQVKSGGLL
jgi:hypothetical protein